MRKINASTTINKPVKTVWNYLDSQEHMAEWIENFVKYEHVSGEPGQVGSKGKHYYNEGGREIVMDEELLERIDNEYLKLGLTSKMLDIEIENFFKPIDKNSMELVTTVVFLRMSPVMKFFYALGGGDKKSQKRQDAQLSRLKNLIEAQ